MWQSSLMGERCQEQPRDAVRVDAKGGLLGRAGHCCYFLSCPGDMEKAAYSFGQMPEGL